MIQRNLLGQSRVLCVKSRHRPTTSLIRSQNSPFRIRSLQERIGSSCYSSTDTPKDGASPDGALGEASQPNIEAADPIRNDLKVKDKEIIDLKVRPKLRKSQCHLLSQPHTFDLSRTGISAQ